jgi:hypothetical protein
MAWPLLQTARSHSQPAIWTAPNGGTLCVWYKSDGHAWVRFTDADGDFEEKQISTINSNSFEYPLTGEDADNEHLTINCCIDAEGYLYVYRGYGASQTGYLKMAKSPAPYTVTGTWTDISDIFIFNEDDTNAYPQVQMFSDGGLILMMRRRNTVAGTLGRFIMWKKEAGGEWTFVGPLILDVANGYWVPYFGHFLIDNNDIVHVNYLWAPETVDPLWKEEPGYMRSHDRGVTWVNVSGAAIATPFDHASPNQLIAKCGSVNPTTTGAVAGVALNASGYPQFVLENVILGTHYNVRWTGTAWTHGQIIDPLFSARTDGINLDGTYYQYGAVRNPPNRFKVQKSGVAGGQFLGKFVESEWEPGADPYAKRFHDQLKLLFVDENDEPYWRTFGGDQPRFTDAI